MADNLDALGYIEGFPSMRSSTASQRPSPGSQAGVGNLRSAIKVVVTPREFLVV